MEPTSEMVRARAQELFPGQDVESILSILHKYGVEPYERERHRVHLDILKLSDGDLDKLRDYVKAAKRDYRDVIYWAEYLERKPNQ